MQLSICYLLDRKSHLRHLCISYTMDFSLNGVQICELSISRFQSLKLPRSTIILDEQFSVGGDLGDIWQHLETSGCHTLDSNG